MLRCHGSSQLVQLHFKNQFNYLNSRNFSYHINDNEKSVEINIPNGRPLILSIGRFGQGTGTCSTGHTTVFSTAISEYQPNNLYSDLQLDTNYRFKHAAIGRIAQDPERYDIGLPQTDTLISRLLYRSLRPLFPAHYNHYTHVSCSVLAADDLYNPEVLGLNAASLALAASDIPWDGPVGAVRVGLIGNEYVLNPIQEQLEEASADFIVVGNGVDSVVAIDGHAKAVPNTNVISAIKFGLEACDTIAQAIEALARKFAKPNRHYHKPCSIDAKIITTLREESELPLTKLFENHTHDRMSRSNSLNKIRTEVIKKMLSMHPEIDSAIITAEYDKILKETFRRNMFDGKRCDGRRHDEIRPIKCAVDLNEPLHGSAFFERGGTQVRSVVALDSVEKELFTCRSSLQKPLLKPFNVVCTTLPHGTAKTDQKYAQRQNIEHADLAGRALLPIIPDEYNYAIKINADIHASDGSSSMAAVCGSSLALLDAGIPIINPVVGAAIGLITKYDSDDPKKLTDYRIITDITNIEDLLGDLDMKVTSTTDGITAIQASMKINGLPLAIVNECIARAQTANQETLKNMQQVCAVPREQQKPCWPAIMQLTVDPLNAQLFVDNFEGLSQIHEAAGIHITYLESNIYKIFAPSQAQAAKLTETILKWHSSLEVPSLEIGAVYPAKIVCVKRTGVLVKLYEAMRPQLMENDFLDSRCFGHPKYLGLEEGKEFDVRYLGVDDDGSLRLARTEYRMNTDEEFMKLLDKFKDKDPELKK